VPPQWRAAVVRSDVRDALELVGVRAQSVRPPPSVGITMRGVRDRFDVGDFSGALVMERASSSTTRERGRAALRRAIAGTC